MFMQLRRGHRYVIVAQESVTRFPEARMLKKIGAKFLNEEILSIEVRRDRAPCRDNGPEIGRVVGQSWS
jgi:hypothetical protein